jgi:hypothetical protein
MFININETETNETDIDNFIEKMRLEWVKRRIQERFNEEEDSKTRELDLRRKLLYNMGKYELEEGEVLCD